MIEQVKMSGEFNSEFNRSQEWDEAFLKTYWVLDCANEGLGIQDDANNDPYLFCSGQILKCSLQFWIAHLNCWYIPSETHFNI